jgi:hypothetical protein
VLRNKEEIMSDVRQKAKDLLRLALNEGTSQQERDTATRHLLTLIEKYDLLSAGGKPINVAAEILNKVISGDFLEQVAAGAERAASGLERIMAAGKRMSDARGEPKKRRRTYR